MNRIEAMLIDEIIRQRRLAKQPEVESQAVAQSLNAALAELYVVYPPAAGGVPNDVMDRTLERIAESANKARGHS